MPSPDELELSSAPPAPPAETETRGRGRPSIAELTAREEAIAAREAELAELEKKLALDAAEANLEMREREMAERQKAVSPGRSAVRSGSIRSEELSAPARGRRYKGGADMPNKYHVPKEEIPIGTSYQWNTHAIYGQEQRHYSVFMAEQGWRPVPASRHPHLAPMDANPNDPIIIDGQILVERPSELTNEALQEEYDKARGEVRMKEDQLYGERPNTPKGQALGIKKEFERPEAELPRGANYSYETPGQGGPVIE